MTTLGDMDVGSLKVLLMGPSGSGKTCLATTLGARATVLDLNNGLASAKMLKDKWTEKRQEVEVKKCWGDGGPEMMWKRTVGYIDSFAKDAKGHALIIDGLSDLTEASLGIVLSMSDKWTVTSPPSTTIAEWGTAIAQLKRLLWKIKSVPSLVVLIGHTQLVEKNKQQKEVLACFGKGLPGDITAAFDEVWYTNATGYGDKRRWELQTLSTGGVECKTRRQLPDSSSMDIGMDGLLRLVKWEWPGAVSSGSEKGEAK